MSVPSDKIDQRITTGTITAIAIPTCLTIIVLILLSYLTIIVSNFNNAQSLSACRGKVSQEIQETFRTDISKLIALAGQAADGPSQRSEQQQLLNDMNARPNYIDEVKKQCGQDLHANTKSLTTSATSTTSTTSTTIATSIPEE